MWEGRGRLYQHAFLYVALLGAVCFGQPQPEPAPAPAPPVPPEPVVEATYDTHAELIERLDAIVAGHRAMCRRATVGTSREGRDIAALRLAMDGDIDPDERPALLLVANIDGDHVVGSAVALAVAELLLAMADQGEVAALELLSDHAVYVIPRVNPDAAERYFADERAERRRNVRPDDSDRDGLIDEDPPNDLNGDGVITMMRVFDPDEADRMADTADPRLDLEPDRDKGQRVAFTLYEEGVDDDGDGEFNEDHLGGVDLNMNFMHGYQEHADGAGPHQVSEPESLALLKFVLDHPNIAVVLVYGLHDNLSKPPDGKGSYPSGAPKNIDAKDAGLYKFISERFTEITGLKKVPGVTSDGAFFAWAYAQYGVPSFTTPLWTRPELEKKQDKTADDAAPQPGGAPETGSGDDGDEGLTPSGIGDISQETLDELRASAEARGMEVSDEMMAQLSPRMIEGFARRAGIEIRRVKAAKDGGGAENKEDAAWLKYSDEQRDGAGFLAWEKFDHPQLGEVEIGGWVPYFRTNPPAGEVPAIAEKQAAFVLDLAGRFPKVSLSDAEVTRLASGLWEIKCALVNDGYLPTGTAMAVRNRRARPYVVRLDIPTDRILTGRRVNKVWSVPGSGGRESFRWIVRAPDGAELTVTVFSEKFGGFDRQVVLHDDGGDS